MDWLIEVEGMNQTEAAKLHPWNGMANAAYARLDDQKTANGSAPCAGNEASRSPARWRSAIWLRPAR